MFSRYIFVRLVAVGFLVLVGGNTYAQVVAVCLDPEGYGYYHYATLVPKDKSGFEKERIKGGVTTLKRLPNGKYDILIVDIRKRPISFRDDGGEIVLVRRGSNDATFLVMFSGMMIELYTFYKDAGGVNRFDILQSKGGDRMPIHKSSVMTGNCSELRLELVK